MKKKLRACYGVMAVLLFVCLFSGCKEKSLPITGLPSEDAQENCISYQMSGKIAESEHSFYYHSNGFTYVIDKNTRKCMPLCAKPDCVHEDEVLKSNCDAHTISHVGEIINYNGSLYYCNDELKVDENGLTIDINKICRMNLDGSDKTEVFRSEDLNFWSFKIHRGYIYIVASEYKEDGSASSDNSCLYRVPVDNGEEFQKLLTFSEFGDTLFDIRFFEDNMFVLINKYVNDTKEKFTFLKVDLDTLESVNINKSLSVPATDMFTIFNGKIITSKDGHVFEADLDGKNQREVIDCNELCKGYRWFTPLSNDGESLMISACKENEYEKETLIVCDKNYRAKTYNLPIDCRVRAFCSPAAMIVEDEGKLYYVDKTKLGQFDCMQEIYQLW